MDNDKHRTALGGWDSDGRTHVGRVRSENQDRFLALSGIIAVADGMGGHAGGGDAASTVVDALSDLVPASGGVNELVAAIEAAHRSIGVEALLTDRPEMGSTVTAVVVNVDGRVAVVHAGDSPAWRWDGLILTRLTVDHVTDVMVTLTDGRQILRSALTRCVGGSRYSVSPDVNEFALNPGDWVIVASDGLTKELDEAMIADIASKSKSPQECSRSLCDTAVHAGGRDNVTVVVGRFSH